MPKEDLKRFGRHKLIVKYGRFCKRHIFIYLYTCPREFSTTTGQTNMIYDKESWVYAFAISLISRLVKQD